MAHVLSHYCQSRDNNFNLIRFAAATLVLLSHSFVLCGGTEPLENRLGMTGGEIAVDIFFITSGFLICGSFISRNNLLLFLRARILRIYPGLIVAAMFCVFFIGLLFTEHSISDYLRDQQTYRFLFLNSTLFMGVEYPLPGVFNETPFPHVVNGSLWTLPYEVMMYAILALLLNVLLPLEKRKPAANWKWCLTVVSAVSLCLHLLNHHDSFLPERFLRLFTMFFYGAIFYAWKERIRLSSTVYVAGLLLLLASAIDGRLFFEVYCLLLPYLVFYSAYVPSGKIRSFNKLGDYSYGIYIYAFPIQQSVASIMPGVSPIVMSASSFGITLVLAICSWELVEKRAMKYK